MKREIGYYWVYDEVNFNEDGGWGIVYWNGDNFTFCGGDSGVSTFEIIDENRIIRK
jgi:hypothetical protein